jgi:hypothetical protein
MTPRTPPRRTNIIISRPNRISHMPHVIRTVDINPIPTRWKRNHAPNPALTGCLGKVLRVRTRTVEIIRLPRLGHTSMTRFPRARWGGSRRSVSTQHAESGLKRGDIDGIRRISIRYIVDGYPRIALQPLTHKLRHAFIRPVPSAEV